MSKPQDEVREATCSMCGYRAYRATDAMGNHLGSWAHDLPEGRTYEQQKCEYPQCWNNAQVPASPQPAQKDEASCEKCGCLKSGHHSSGCEGSGGNCGCTEQFRPEPKAQKQGEGEMLYSRNKWHMLCSTMGWNAETTAAAQFIDAIRSGQEENKELKERIVALEEMLQLPDENDPLCARLIDSATLDPERQRAKAGGTIGDWMRRAEAAEAKLASQPAPVCECFYNSDTGYHEYCKPCEAALKSQPAVEAWLDNSYLETASANYLKVEDDFEAGRCSGHRSLALMNLSSAIGEYVVKAYRQRGGGQEGA